MSVVQTSAALAALVAAAVTCGHAAAAPPRIELGMGVGWLLSGASSDRGKPGNPRGGAALFPRVRLSWSPGPAWLDLAYSQSPIVVTPFSVDQLGIIDANDIGVLVHTPESGFMGHFAATVAPSWFRFCNVEWCEKPASIVWGAIAEGSLNVAVDQAGRGLYASALVRILYANPVAWQGRPVVPTMVAVLAGGSMRW